MTYRQEGLTQLDVDEEGRLKRSVAFETDDEDFGQLIRLSVELGRLEKAGKIDEADRLRADVIKLTKRIEDRLLFALPKQAGQ